MDEAVRTLSELKEFLANFDKTVEKLGSSISDLQIPKFRIPNWPKGLPKIKVRTEDRELLYPQMVSDTEPLAQGLLALYKKTIHLGVDIWPDGSIGVGVWERHVERPFLSKTKTEYQAILPHFSSKEDGPLDRLCCFILFHQCLDEICSEITRMLQERLIKLEGAVKDYEPVIEGVRRSFEPLIPFLVADELGR